MTGKGPGTPGIRSGNDDPDSRREYPAINKIYFCKFVL